MTLVINEVERRGRAPAALRPEDAATFAADAATFTEGLEELEQGEAAIEAEHAGAGVTITEPLPGYLLDAAGLVNKTPDAFHEAIEEDTESLSPAA